MVAERPKSAKARRSPQGRPTALAALAGPALASPFSRTATRHWPIWGAPFGPARKQPSTFSCSTTSTWLMSMAVAASISVAMIFTRTFRRAPYLHRFPKKGLGKFFGDQNNRPPTRKNAIGPTEQFVRSFELKIIG